MRARTALDAHRWRPRKKWGQHFLTDPKILESVADAAEITDTNTVLEIGPGLGHLTRVLASRAKRVVAVEVDADLVAKLRNDFADAHNVSIVQGDFLQREPMEWLRKETNPIGAGVHPAPRSIHYKIVGNLPYYITSAILRHSLEAEDKPCVVVVTVQRQVAQRIIAQPPEMNLLAVSVQFYSRPRIVRTIAAGAFYPRPQVDSAVVRLEVYPVPPIAVQDTNRFFEIVRAGFGERRKQLRNSLSHNLAIAPSVATTALERAGIEPKRRAETLLLEEWGALCRALPKYRSTRRQMGV